MGDWSGHEREAIEGLAAWVTDVGMWWDHVRGVAYGLWRGGRKHKGHDRAWAMACGIGD